MEDMDIPPSVTLNRQDMLLVCDMFSISLDGGHANNALFKRSENTREKHVFLKVSGQFQQLSDYLFGSIGRLPKDTGTLTLEAGYIAKAYVLAMTATKKYAPNRVMVVNRQALIRIKKLSMRLKNRLFARGVHNYLDQIKVTLGRIERQPSSGQLANSKNRYFYFKETV